MVTIDEIKTIGQSGKRLAAGSPYYHVVKTISPYFTKFFIKHNLGANQITSCSIILGITANLTFIFGNHHLLLLSCVIYQSWRIVDIVDGEIARVTNVKTPGAHSLGQRRGALCENGKLRFEMGSRVERRRLSPPDSERRPSPGMEKRGRSNRALEIWHQTVALDSVQNSGQNPRNADLLRIQRLEPASSYTISYTT